MTVFARAIRVLALASVAVVGVACSSGGSDKTSDTTTAKKTTTSTGSSGLRSLGKPADGLYYYDLVNGGVKAKLKMSASDGKIGNVSMDLVNGGTTAITDEPIVYLVDDTTGVKYDSKDLDWNKVYPPGSSGMAAGGSGGFSLKFEQNFDPTKVTVCLKAGSTDMGCFVKGQA